PARARATTTPLSSASRPTSGSTSPRTRYIADGYGNHRVIVFDAPTGADKRHWGAYGKRPADETPAQLAAGGEEGVRYNPNAPVSQTFNNPVHCVKVANDGLVYVCDRKNDRVQVFRKD